MTAGVVAVGRQQYAVGLYWENSPGGGRAAQIAKEAAKQPGQHADFFVVRPGNKDGRVPQFGLCSKEAGQKAGMPVLAACLANQIPGSWAGAFRLNEGVVIIIVRDDLIVPDGDLFFPDETEARDRLIQEMGFGGLQTTYAPEAWSIPGADTIPLTLLLNDRRDIQLQQVYVPQKVKYIAAGGVAFFVIILGIIWYEQVQSDNERMRAQEEALRRMQQSTHLSGLLQQPPPEPKYIRYWENEPPALSVINACQEGLAKVPSAVAGWNLTSLKCTKGSIILNWTCDKTTAVPPAGVKVNETGTTGTQTVPLAALSPRGPENLQNIDDITNRYLSQNWPGVIARAQDDPPPEPPSDYNGAWNPPPPPWVKRSFTLHVSELPASLPDQIGNLPGAVINSLSYTPSGGAGSWAIEGIIYENRR